MENQKLQNMVKFSFPEITTFIHDDGTEKKTFFLVRVGKILLKHLFISIIKVWLY